MKQWLSIILLITCIGLTRAQETPLVSAAIDTTNIRIGEQFTLKININEIENVIVPKLEKLNGIEIVEEKPIDTLKKGLLKEYLLTGFDSGAFYIPSQQIFIRNRAYFTDSLLINVATVAVDTSKVKMFPIKNIESEPYLFDDFVPYAKWFILGILAIGILIFFFLRRKKTIVEEEYSPALPPLEEALEKLKALDNKLLWQNNEVKAYYSELTEIVRAFIERELQIPALESTTDELMSMLNDFSHADTIVTEEDTLKRLKALLQEADLVKFAKSKPLDFEIEEDRRDAEAVINTLTIQPKTETDELD